MAVAGAANPVNLPGGHSLQKNATGEYFVQNKSGRVSIHPAILALGYDESWIVACVRNNDIREAETKRFVFMSVSKAGATDTINRNNWDYLIKEIPALGKIKLKQLGKEKCL